MTFQSAQLYFVFSCNYGVSMPQFDYRLLALLDGCFASKQLSRLFPSSCAEYEWNKYIFKNSSQSIDVLITAPANMIYNIVRSKTSFSGHHLSKTQYVKGLALIKNKIYPTMHPYNLILNVSLLVHWAVVQPSLIITSSVFVVSFPCFGEFVPHMPEVHLWAAAGHDG